jgi:LPXTG-motif cell wall-anchored protein
MQTGNEQSTVALSTLGFTILGSLGSRFVFPTVLSAPQVVSKILSVNPNKGDKWKK